MRKRSYEAELERAPAFPIYQIAGEAAGCSETSKAPTDAEGRLLLGGNVSHDNTYGGNEVSVARRVAAAATENDVFWMPLYRSDNTQSVFSPLPRLDGYAERMELLLEVAPKVTAVLVGNAGAECSFWPHPDQYGQRVGFVQDHCEMIAAAGGRPAFAPTPMELLKDMEQGCPLQEAWLARDALVICLCGFKLVPGTFIDTGIEGHQYFLDVYEENAAAMSEYVKAIETWTGVQFVEGLRHRNDVLLSEFGFKAGVVGKE